MTQQQQQQQQQHTTHFQTRKANCLSKRDKSSAGRIDPRAVDICAEINAREEYYTTSSCSGRCFLYCGDGIKSWHAANVNEESGVGSSSSSGGGVGGVGHGFFQRTRVNHDLIQDPTRYFNLSTLVTDRTGGGDPIPTIGQFESLNNNENFKNKLDETAPFQSSETTDEEGTTTTLTTPIWLRYEPFILHVMCRSLKAASVLMATARPSFKNVGLTSWNNGGGGSNEEDDVNNNNDDNNINNVQTKNQQCKGGGPRYLVAIWGDEGLDMPLSLPSTPRRGLFYNCDDDNDESSGVTNAEWLAQLVNERHCRNWKKIERFVEAMRSLEEDTPVDDIRSDDVMMMDSLTLEEHDNDDDSTVQHHHQQSNNKSARVLSGLPIPRSYDVVGDVAILNNLPEGDEETQKKVGEWIMKKNKAIKIVVARHCPLSTEDRSPGSSGLKQLAGHPRDPIVTSHYEYGIKCVVDLNHTFFSPRMAPERLRLSQQVARGERVLVVFAGVGMDALQIAARTEAKEVLVIERNEIACECIRRGKLMLSRNKTAPCPGSGQGASERLHILEGDALELLPTLEKEGYDRIVAPRPKEGSLDGDLGTGDAGMAFLLAMLPLLKLKGECHWYDFAADHELPNCDRTRKQLESACQTLGLEMEVLHVARVGSIAKRQWRVCVDFRIIGKKSAT